MSILKNALYIVATPLGNPDDISHRALETLAGVDVIAAEDTRRIKRLMQHFNLGTACISLHEHNEAQASAQVVQRLQAGQSVALVSDAGTPLISDPGYELIRMAQAAGLRIIPVPGPSALTAALSVAGLPNDRFVFEGFLPPRAAARRVRLEQLRDEPRTLVFYEAPHRILETLRDMTAVFGPQREAAIARELTKTFETVRRDSLEALTAWVAGDSDQQRGEIVVLVHGASQAPRETARVDMRALLEALLPGRSTKEAVALAADLTGEKRNRLYEMALEIRET
ncbi:MAG TPA: 16S rRNA (cytidine(1402)-2'-O)-methyltransferase [Gammaproteobacteria bacterium]|nr:16S rRNA (cytidine(1402)-2'-O)-methyltransferase [Gammaproteobacteria bacterium]